MAEIPAEFLSDEQIRVMCSVIKRGYGAGGFPMDKSGNLTSWTDWFRSEITDAMLAERAKIQAVIAKAKGDG